MSDEKAPNTDEDIDDEPDAPTRVGEVDETLLKARKQRGMPDAQVLDAPKAKETPTQPPPAMPPPQDEDESATNVVLSEQLPVIIATPPLPRTMIADEDQSETLSAVKGVGPLHRDPRHVTTAKIDRKPSALRRFGLPVVVGLVLAGLIAYAIVKL